VQPTTDTLKVSFALMEQASSDMSAAVVDQQLATWKGFSSARTDERTEHLQELAQEAPSTSRAFDGVVVANPRSVLQRDTAVKITGSIG
jgi:hypothetical protein